MSSLHDSDNFFTVIDHAAVEAVRPLTATSRSDIDHPTGSIVMTNNLYNPDIAVNTTGEYAYPLINLESANWEELETSMVSQSAGDSSIAFPRYEFDVPSSPKVEIPFADGAFNFNDDMFKNILAHYNYGWGNALRVTSDPQSGQSIDFTSTLMSPSVISDRDWFTLSPEITSTHFKN